MPADPYPERIAPGYADGFAWEQISPGEGDVLATICALAERRGRQTATQQPTALRDAHANIRGRLEAQFHILPGLPATLAKALFAQSAVYAAWVRFSDGFATPENSSQRKHPWAASSMA